MSQGAKAGALLAGGYPLVIVSEAAPAWRQGGAGGSWEHPVLNPGVTLPPLCWEGGGGFPFWGWLLLWPVPSPSCIEHRLVASWETHPRMGLCLLSGR